MTFARDRSEWLERREAQKAARLAALCQPAKARGVYAPVAEAPAPMPKSTAYRDDALLEMARGRPCLLLVPAVCSHRTDTTVAAHSNLLEHGKGKGRKADDLYSIFACHACHSWLDQGPAPAEMKRAAFMEAFQRQMRAWRQISMDAGEPARFRRAAQRALEDLEDRE